MRPFDGSMTVLARTDSTNTRLKELARNGEPLISARIFPCLLRIPTARGKKSASEKFP